MIQSTTEARIGILGGTFNPIHIGHIRLALEVQEALKLQRVDLMPCAVPPHKPAQGLLPFALRETLARKAILGSTQLGISQLETTLPPPSYTWNLLEAWRAQNSAYPVFILGDEDFACIDRWCHGKQLPGITDLAVVPRAGMDATLFMQTMKKLWPDVEAEAFPHISGALRALMPCAVGGFRNCWFLPLPRIEISASIIRERWLRGANIRYLVPDDVLEAMENNAAELRQYWQPTATTTQNNPG